MWFVFIQIFGYTDIWFLELINKTELEITIWKILGTFGRDKIL